MTTTADTREIIDELKKRHVRFLLLQFTDLLGVKKAVEVPSSQFERALAGEVTFDGGARGLRPRGGSGCIARARPRNVPRLPLGRRYGRGRGGRGGRSGRATDLRHRLS